MDVLNATEMSSFLKDARATLKKDFQRIIVPIPFEKDEAEKKIRTYEGSDEIDGVQIFKRPSRFKAKSPLFPYEENDNTVVGRKDKPRGKFNEKDMLGLPVVENVNGLYVVRDDLLAGGTKSRMIYNLVASGDNKEWVYASPAQGYAQVALALCCAMCGKKAIIYLAKSAEMHPLTKAAWEAGAEIRMVPMGFLSNVTAKAIRYVQQHERASLVPFGADHADVVSSLGKTVCALPFEAPKNVWSICSTGTLSRGLQSGWTKSKFFGVMVGHVPTKRQRGKCTVYIAPELYHQPAKVRPPFPSALCYDAKLWRFVDAWAKKGDVVWNVGA